MSSAIKRIKADIRELAQHSTSAYSAAPLEDNMFVWHFTIREYPFKPPSIMLLTPNGRFETNTKICLSMTDYHPEHWQPAWGIRTILEALVAFFPTPADSAIGALQWRPDERIALATASRTWVCPQCGPICDLLEEEEEGNAPLPSPPREIEFVGAGNVLGGTAVSESKRSETSGPGNGPVPASSEGSASETAPREESLSSPGESADPDVAATTQPSSAAAPAAAVAQQVGAGHPLEDRLIFGLITLIAALLLKKFLAA